MGSVGRCWEVLGGVGKCWEVYYGFRRYICIFRNKEFEGYISAEIPKMFVISQQPTCHQARGVHKENKTTQLAASVDKGISPGGKTATTTMPPGTRIKPPGGAG